MAARTARSFVDRFIPRAVVTRPVRVLGIANLIVNVVIVVTGGAVRLTASGLGCPTWPSCTSESLVTTPEMGIHGVIEFTNRLLTFVLVLVAIAAFVSVLRLRKGRPPLFWLALGVGLGIPAQAIIGGISVLTQLNPYVVGLHFVVSAVLVALCTVFVALTYDSSADGHAPPRMLALVWTMIAFQSITVVLGILTTGSGPHAGDALAPRNNLNSELLQHVHSIPAYIGLGLGVLSLSVGWFMHRRIFATAIAIMLATNLLQIAVGITQSHLGLPAALVTTHMFLACVVVAAMTFAVTTLRDARPGGPAQAHA